MRKLSGEKFIKICAAAVHDSDSVFQPVFQAKYIVDSLKMSRMRILRKNFASRKYESEDAGGTIRKKVTVRGKHCVAWF